MSNDHNASVSLPVSETVKTPTRTNRHSNIRRHLVVAVTFLAVVLILLIWPPNANHNDAPLGAVKVYAYDLSTGSTLEDMQKAELGDVVGAFGVWGPAINMLEGIPLKFQVEDEALKDKEIKFHIHVNGGEFVGDRRLDKYKTDSGSAEPAYRLGNDFVIDNGEVIEWQVTTADWEAAIAKDGRVFVEAIITSEEHIIGYAVLEIISIPDSSLYGALKIKTEYYPLENSKYQEINQSDILEQIDACKNASPQIQN